VPSYCMHLRNKRGVESAISNRRLTVPVFSENGKKGHVLVRCASHDSMRGNTSRLGPLWRNRQEKGGKKELESQTERKKKRFGQVRVKRVGIHPEEKTEGSRAVSFSRRKGGGSRLIGGRDSTIRFWGNMQSSSTGWGFVND